MKPKLFQFASYPDPLWVAGGLCANPECECGDVFIDLVENDEARPYNLGRTILSMRFDTATWEDSQSPARPASLDCLARDFVREYPAAERAAWHAEVVQKRHGVRRMREYRLDPRAVETGKLIAFVDIVSERGSIWSGGSTVTFGLVHDGVEYLVADLYCPNPDCDCGDCYLAFFRETPSPRARNAPSLEHCFLTTLSLDGRIKSVECQRGTKGEALAVLKAWRDGPDFARDLEDFQWQDWKVKQIAKRSYSGRSQADPAEDRQSPPVERLSSAGRVGRNEPCPCGSGKKYKKCCGKAAG
jgi:hypothetical protein